MAYVPIDWTLLSLNSVFAWLARSIPRVPFDDQRYFIQKIKKWWGSFHPKFTEFHRYHSMSFDKQTITHKWTKRQQLSLIGPHFLLFFIVLSTLIILIFTLNYDHNWGGDFSAYIMQAKSICEFSTTQFVENNRITIEQSSRRIGPIAYPWGFPLMLAPIYYFLD